MLYNKQYLYITFQELKDTLHNVDRCKYTILTQKHEQAGGQ